MPSIILDAEDWNVSPRLIWARGGWRLAVRREARLAAQVLTEDGTFDFIGMKSGAQTIEAQGTTGSTPEPVKSQLKDDEAKNVRLILAPYRWLNGTVLTPFGRPATGAVIQVLRDQGHGAHWTKVVTDVAVQFRWRLGSFLEYHFARVVRHHHSGPERRADGR